MAEAAAECASLLDGVTGSHALLLDATDGPIPQVPGIGRWTMLKLSAGGQLLAGPLRAEVDALPFSDGSFSLVLIRHLLGAGTPAQPLVAEAARVLASHGLLCALEFHSISLWRPWLLRRSSRGEESLRVVPPGRLQGILRANGLMVRAQWRCGAPWPRATGMQGLPRWTAEAAGAVYLLKARKRDSSGVVRRLHSRRTRSAREQVPWAPGAQRTKA
ncbi:MAG TPA: methyltransferase domain-containing protein [Rhodanobacteraceae bacterium]|jgi:SAM-dependent methyltransferase